MVLSLLISHLLLPVQTQLRILNKANQIPNSLTSFSIKVELICQITITNKITIKLTIVEKVSILQIIRANLIVQTIQLTLIVM